MTPPQFDCSTCISFYRLQYGILVESLVRLVEASGCGPTPLNADDTEEQGTGLSTVELERNDPYCKLSYAQHPDTIAIEIVNFKGFLSLCLSGSEYKIQCFGFCRSAGGHSPLPLIIFGNFLKTFGNLPFPSINLKFK